MRLGPPPGSLAQSPVVYSLVPGTRLACFYDPTRGTWNRRRRFGPLSDVRFDHHPPPLRIHAAASAWYASTSLLGALSEAFGRLGFVDRRSGRRVAVVRVASALALVDLVGVGARRIGLTQEIASTSEYALCQTWARAIHGSYAGVQGIRWRGRQAGAICIVLTERAPQASLALESDHDIADVRVWPRVARAARRCNLPIL